jgi:hypothetical protein
VPANMIAKDNHDYVVRSITSSGQKVVIAGSFATKLTAASILSANISITGMTTNTANQLSFLNVSSGTWDTVSNLSFGLTNKTVNVGVTGIGSYLDANGTLKFRVSGSSSGTTQFRLGIDQIQLNATVSTP